MTSTLAIKCGIARLYIRRVNAYLKNYNKVNLLSAFQTLQHYPADSKRNPSTLDITLTNYNSSLSTLKTSKNFSSDHLLVSFSAVKEKANVKPDSHV